jgi:GT2 family glycosyltransferase
MAKVSALILNYNGKKFINGCLKSVFSQDYPGLEVYLVDNASNDGSLELAKERFPQVRILANQNNLGFSRAMNQAIEVSKTDYLLLLNVDVILESNYLSEAMKVILANDQVGSVAGKIYRMNSDSEKIIDTTGHQIFKNRLSNDRGEGETDYGQYDQLEEIFGVCAAVGLYRRAMLEDTKVDGQYFDEDFFMFLEDVDLSWRAQLRKWKCMYAPKAVAYHHRGGIAKRRTKLVEMHNYKNRYFLIAKNDYFMGIVKNFHHFVLTDSLKTGALILRCPPAILGWGHVISSLPSIWRKRRIIQKSRLISPSQLEKKWFKPFNYIAWIKRHWRGF